MPDELDKILDQAIRSYSAAEPSPDLAGRILYQTRLQIASPRRGWKPVLAVALPFAAAVALAFVLLAPWTLPKPPATIASAPSTPSVVQPAKTLGAAAEPVQPHRRVRKAASRSSENGKSWARPLPAPYSKEELALLTFAQQHPKEAAEIAESQKQDMAPLKSQPITISHLEIKPLSIAPLR
jgi:hypothetical protein